MSLLHFCVVLLKFFCRESTRSFIEKVGQPVIAEEFQEAIDFAEELTAKQMIPDGVRRKRK